MYYSMSFVPCKNNNMITTGPLNYLEDLGWVRNTWVHWHIVPIERYAIDPPELKTSYVDVPGYNGKLDLTQALTPYPVYKNRSGTMKFAVLNGYRNWQTAYTDIMTFLHGKKMFMVYEEDPEYYYVGRWSVNKWKSDKTRSEIALDYDLEPYKWRLYDAQGSWLWDPFNFTTGVIQTRATYYNLHNVRVDSDTTAELLLYTQVFEGNSIEDSIGEGLYDAQENISSVIGNAAVPMRISIIPDEDSSVTITYLNPELTDSDVGVRRTYSCPMGSTVSYTIENDPELQITNWTGANGISLNVLGHGSVDVNFRPGRL